MQRGLLIFAPCGTGKSHFVRKYGEILQIEDGDVILEQEGVKNRNYFWYGNYPSQQEEIRRAITTRLDEGVHVLYSGNPLVWKPDIIVHIDANTRWNQLKYRHGFVPTSSQFDREEEAYLAAMKDVIYVDNFDVLRKYLEGLQGK